MQDSTGNTEIKTPFTVLFLNEWLAITFNHDALLSLMQSTQLTTQGFNDKE